MRITIMLFLILPVCTALGQPGPVLPLQPPPVPPGNPITAAKVNLGKALFWDEQLSSTRSTACGTCHIPESGSSDPRSIIGLSSATHPGLDALFGTPDDVTGSPGVPHSQANGLYDSVASFGIGVQVTGRKANSAINAAYSPLLFWDGRATGTLTDPISGAVIIPNGAALESQVLGPPVSDVEMSHAGRDWNNVAARVAASKPLALSPLVPTALSTWIADRSYPELFTEAFGDAAVTPVRIAMAIATYERTLWSNQAPIDLAIGGIAPLPFQQQQGRAVFNQNGCNTCHGGNRFTDDLFHYIGVRPVVEDFGRFVETGAPPDRGAFRTPSLRNVGLRGPYFHGGQFATLEEVVDFYNRGGDFNAPNKAPQMVPLGLTPQERTDLVAFLRDALTDPRVANAQAPFDRPMLYSESSRAPQIVDGGKIGSGGLMPRAIAVEPPIAGNPNFTVGVQRALGGASAILVIDDSLPSQAGPIPSSGSVRYHFAVTLSGSGAGQGFGSIAMAIPVEVSMFNKPLFGRWFIADGGAAGGVATSDAFRIDVFTMIGDMNGDGLQNQDDASAFVLALVDPAGYSATYGLSAAMRGDFTQDGSCDGDDILAMVKLLMGG